MVPGEEIFFYLKSPVRKIGLKIPLLALCYLLMRSMRVLLSHNVSLLEKVLYHRSNAFHFSRRTYLTLFG